LPAGYLQTASKQSRSLKNGSTWFWKRSATRLVCVPGYSSKLLVIPYFANAACNLAVSGAAVDLDVFHGHGLGTGNQGRHLGLHLGSQRRAA
jgi:hypothetical protein